MECPTCPTRLTGPTSRLPTLGDWVSPNGSQHNQYTPRSSDFMPAHFRAYAQATNDPTWNEVLNQTQSTITHLQTTASPTSGLLPDFITSPLTDPTPAPPGFLEDDNDGSGVEYAETLAKAAAVPDVDTVITGHFNTTVGMADVKMYSDFNREFVEHVRSAKQAGRTAEEASTWTVPERFMAAGYTQPTPAALLSNVNVVWKELK